MILHTLNASPTTAAFHNCLEVAQQGDTIVLLGDGVYAALAGTTASLALQKEAVTLCMLDLDAALAGVMTTGASVRTITMEELVILTETHSRIQAWY